MHSAEATTDLGIADRVRRSGGRRGRVISTNAKVTRDEHDELEAAAKREGKALGEWAREVLLEKARSGPTGTAIFTELIALRLLMNGVLRSIVVGEKMSPQIYQQLVTEVRNTKRDAARDVLTQYQNPTGGQ